MLGKLKFGFLMGLSLIIIGFSSCSGENVDITTMDDDDVDVDVVIDPVVLDSCSNNLTLKMSQDSLVNFSEDAEALLFKATCADFGQFPPLFDHNYVIYDVTWDSWGTNQAVGYTDISDGIPGISVGSNGVPEVGDVLTTYGGFENLFRTPQMNTAYGLTGLVITITETGDEVGEAIGGTISGTIYDYNNPEVLFDVEGSFCAPVIGVCE